LFSRLTYGSLALRPVALLALLVGADRTLIQPTRTFTSGLPTGWSPAPSPDITTVPTGNLHWRDSRPLDHQLASLHVLDHSAPLVVWLAPPLLYVQADTVARWQRERFHRFWARLSKRHSRRRGRPATAVEIRRLIEQMVVANPLWRAPRIHGELKMLGIAISERTVSRILRGLRRPPTQTWKTFLHNHLNQSVSIDFFSAPQRRRSPVGEGPTQIVVGWI